MTVERAARRSCGFVLEPDRAVCCGQAAFRYHLLARKVQLYRVPHPAVQGHVQLDRDQLDGTWQRTAEGTRMQWRLILSI